MVIVWTNLLVRSIECRLNADVIENTNDYIIYFCNDSNKWYVSLCAQGLGASEKKHKKTTI
jgi:hypothetical protein